MAFKYMCGSDAVYLPIIVNDALVAAADEAYPNQLTLYNRTMNFGSEALARSYLTGTYIPALLRALASYGITPGWMAPIFTTEDVQVGSAYGLTRPYIIKKTLATSQTISAPSGHSFAVTTRKTSGNNYYTMQDTPTAFPGLYIDAVKTGNSPDEDNVNVAVIDRARTKAYQLRIHANVVYSSVQSAWVAECSGIVNLKFATFSASYLGEEIPDDDPLTQGGEPETSGEATGSPFTGVGGLGTFSRTPGSVGFPSAPAISATQTGLVTLYVGSASHMHALADYLWSNLFDLDTFKKLFNDPMECIIGASILPCTPSSDNTATIIFGNIDTGISMPKATDQFKQIDCGSINVTEYFGAYLDYSPYTKAHIFLPYIGYKELNVDEIMGKSLAVKYLVDCLSGAITVCVAAGGNVLYQYSGSCATPIPLTANNWGQVLTSIVEVAGQAVGGAAAGPAGALIAGGSALADSAIAGGFKPDIIRAGSVTGSGGALGVQVPYLILEWPNQSKVPFYPQFEGYPTNDTLLLSQCMGYTRVEEINLEGIPCTSAELAEIETLLKGGVLI